MYPAKRGPRRSHKKFNDSRLEKRQNKKKNVTFLFSAARFDRRNPADLQSFENNTSGFLLENRVDNAKETVYFLRDISFTFDPTRKKTPVECRTELCAKLFFVRDGLSYRTRLNYNSFVLCFPVLTPATVNVRTLSNPPACT